MPEEKTCFVIAPIGEPESETRKRSDQILKHVIEPATKECGYIALRADHISEPGIITSQVIQHVVDDPLVIADLTDRNPNVSYELALRHAIKKPLVQVIKKGESIPFDVAGTRTIHVDHHDLDSVQEAKTEIAKQIRAVEIDASQIDTPISVALDLQLLKHSDNPEQRSLADVVSVLAELRTAFLLIDKRLSDPKTFVPSEFMESLMSGRGLVHNANRFKHDLYRLMSAVDELSKSENLMNHHREALIAIRSRIEWMLANLTT